MNTKDLLKTILLENQTMELPTIWKRTVELPLDTDKILVLSGVRYCGKTWLLLDYIKKLMLKGIPRESILYFNWEEERIDLSEESLNLLIPTYQELYPDKQLSECYLILDEIQHIPDGRRMQFLSFLYHNVSKRMVIAGANKSLIPGNEKLVLEGNVIFLELYPLSFREIISITHPSIDPHNNSEKQVLSDLFKRYRSEGGFPGIIGKDASTRNRMLQGYFREIIQLDLLSHFYIPDPDIVYYYCHYLASRNAKNYCLHQVYKKLIREGVSLKKEFLDYFNLFTQAIYFNKVVNHKTYLIDQGLGAAINYPLSQDKQRLLENTVVLELLKQGKVATDFEVSRILNQSLPVWQQFL